MTEESNEDKSEVSPQAQTTDSTNVDDSPKKKKEFKPVNAQSPAASFKVMLLVLMVVQNSALALVGRYTRSSVSKEDMFVVNHIILICELTKLILASGLEYYSTGGKLWQSVKENIIDNPLDFLKILIPSLLYLVQNSLLFVALTNLPAPIYQVTYQGKLLTTAFVSVVMLQRKYATKQWVCLMTLAVGVAVVVLGENNQKAKATSEEESTEEGDDESDKPSQSMTLGLTAVTIACFCSAFAGVYTEKLLKRPSTSGTGNTKGPVSLWMRNIQMAFFSICIALIQGAISKGEDSEKPFMHGFTFLVYVLVLIMAVGGLLVAAVMKYADNVLKGLATGVSVVVATACSMVLFKTPLTKEFVMGGSLVLGSVYFFSNDLPAILKKSIEKETKPSDVEMQSLTSENKE